jgi:uncharacterized iron-regulated protein
MYKGMTMDEGTGFLKLGTGLRAGLLMLVAWLALSACGHRPEPLRLTAPVLLLGEVHDNAAGHRLRLAAFDELLARGDRPALVLEQFDRGDQAVIDTARARQPPPDAATLVAAVLAARGVSTERSGWQWPFYEPFIARALARGLPIVAANVGRADARQIMRDGLAAHGFDPAVPDAVLAALAQDIEASHCGMLDTAMAQRMALAQVARDQQMARALQTHAAQGAVLLAGNGHVRTDIGVPRWLDPATRARSQAIGVLESAADTAPFDQRAVVTPQARPDPCAGMPDLRRAAPVKAAPAPQ